MLSCLQVPHFPHLPGLPPPPKASPTTRITRPSPRSLRYRPFLSPNQILPNPPDGSLPHNLILGGTRLTYGERAMFKLPFRDVRRPGNLASFKLYGLWTGLLDPDIFHLFQSRKNRSGIAQNSQQDR
ncbi:Hypothetical protein NTJ_13300 [Nesidiocoris tenuis]|uniref:Uncharacterized protein n=1 Tax=Nesidiocoris tenuis TaxID=355587 RepID=A0ABN7BA27_9HEMI|nr:Hypothetical protein NTJ_13300 [Nesidiocoris tenuis]